MDMTNSMLINLGALKNMWREALLVACYILNRVSFKDRNKIPFELWKSETPRLDYLKVWGCLAKVGISKSRRKKINPKTVDAIFVGYFSKSNINRFLVANSVMNDISNNTLIKARDAIYFENVLYFKK